MVYSVGLPVLCMVFQDIYHIPSVCGEYRGTLPGTLAVPHNMECGEYLGILRGILSVLQNIVMDMNEVMLELGVDLIYNIEDEDLQ